MLFLSIFSAFAISVMLVDTLHWFVFFVIGGLLVLFIVKYYQCHHVTKKKFYIDMDFLMTMQLLYDAVYEFDLTKNVLTKTKNVNKTKNLITCKNMRFTDFISSYAQNNLREKNVSEFINYFSYENLEKLFYSGKTIINYDFKSKCSSSDYCWKKFYGRIFISNKTKSLKLIIFEQDVHEEKLKEKMLLDKLKIDPFTNLLNKVETNNQIANAIANAGETKQAFVMMDIDNFKTINDKYGHAYGDFVLSEVSKNLMCSFEQKGFIGRVGGDEFVVYMPKIEDNNEIINCVEKFRMLCASIKKTDSKNYDLSFSIGISLYPEHGKNFEELYEKADSALYTSKNKGKNGYTFYETLSTDKE
ncbi:MAG: GGDEF domain-containing protein [Clostridia bacterium]